MTAALPLACGRGEPPARLAYVAPPAGAVYRYVGFTNTITGTEGMRTRFVDDSGRAGSRLALFISESPGDLAEVDSTELATLWPLTLFRKSVLTVRQGGRAWKWAFEVVGAELVTVPAGTYETYVVRALQGPASPPGDSAEARQTPVVAYVWWYAPTIGAVVRFQTRYLNGPAAGRSFGSELKAIVTPRVAASSTGVGR